MPKLHDDARHVVPAKAVCLPWVGCDAVIQKSLDDLWYLLALLQPRADEVADLLVGLDVPDAVAADHEELVLLASLGELDVWRRADDLLLGPSSGVLLVLEIPKRPRKVQVSVHTVLARPGVLDVAAGRLYPALLPRVVGLVVLAQGDGAAPAAEDRPAVARVRNDELVLRDAADAGGAADEVRVDRPGRADGTAGRLRGGLVRQALQLGAAGAPVLQELVHAVEGADQRRLEVAGRAPPLQSELAQLLGQVPLAEPGNLLAAVAVHDAEEPSAAPISVCP
mmetsp:Transcript_58915/g.184914  ORF Transcript_58915/g.184914 Transcript_58915/m.184914 type:complete len:281 (-) Transcript_58915:233-1075(-)